MGEASTWMAVLPGDELVPGPRRRPPALNKRERAGVADGERGKESNGAGDGRELVRGPRSRLSFGGVRWSP